MGWREEQAETAKQRAREVRVLLAELYPDVKFRVVGHRVYSWAVTVSWTDGPSEIELVDALADAGAGVTVYSIRTLTLDLLAWSVWRGKDFPEFVASPSAAERSPAFEVFATLARDDLGKSAGPWKPDRNGIRYYYWHNGRLKRLLADLGGRRSCELLAS